MVSRVTTATLYRELVSRVGRLQTQLADAQSEASSQRRLREASDDPSGAARAARLRAEQADVTAIDRKSTRLNSSHQSTTRMPSSA